MIDLDLDASPLFEPYTDPETQVRVYVLTRRVAPFQQSFYFVNSGFSDDGRYLWFHCAFPPGGGARLGRTMGLVDFATQQVRHVPVVTFRHAAPWVDPATGELFWMWEDALWRLRPEPDDAPRLVGRIPEKLIGHRYIHRSATHLTRSADGREFFVDAAIGLGFVFGSMRIDDGTFTLWHRFDRNFNHAQFSPTDPGTVLFAMENHPDQLTGEHIPITDRLWLIRRGEAPRPIRPEPTVVTHEWWDDDGEHAWCIRCGGEQAGAWRVAIDSGDCEIVWPGPRWHAHHHPGGRYLVGDVTERFYRGCPSAVDFFDRQTGRELRIIHNPARHDDTGARFHIDPHPRFCAAGRFVVFTTTVRGEVDLALVPTADLIDRLG